MRYSVLNRHVFRFALALSALTLGSRVARAHPGLEDALARLNAGIAAAPDDAELYVERGELYAAHADWIAAEANYLRAAELAPRHPRLEQARGFLALSTGRTKEALAFFDASLARNSADPELLVLRARAHIALGQRGRAVVDLNAALALLAAPPPELFLERASLLPPAEAVASLDEGIQRIGPAFTLHLRALDLEESLGLIEAAVARIDAMARLSERKEAWLKRRGDILARAGRSAEAQAAYTAALAAITALPEWLRTSPAMAQFAEELSRLAAPRTTPSASSS